MRESLALTTCAKGKQKQCEHRQDEIEVRTEGFHWATEQYKPVASGQLSVAS